VKESRSPRPARARWQGRILVRLDFNAYPIQSSLGVLGRKWALLVLMNIALGKARRFNEMLRSTPGMSKRILAMRLRELEANGFVTRAETTRKYTRWQITPKGADVLPVLLTLIHYGARWHPADAPFGFEKGKVFEITYSKPHGGNRAHKAEPDRDG
jgi:DNA-binding HxlR family transcriptional regulator